MKTLRSVGMILSVSLSALVGCAQQQNGSQNSIYMRPVPAAVSSDVASAIESLTKANPITAEARENVRSALAGMDAGDAWGKSREKVKALRDAGMTAIPLVAETLNSREDGARLRAIVALRMIYISPKSAKQSRTQIESLLINISRRSLADKDIRVREEALGFLITLGLHRPPNRIPAGVVMGLEEALKDPSESIRQGAQNAKEDLGLAPRPENPPRGIS